MPRLIAVFDASHALDGIAADPVGAWASGAGGVALTD